MISYRGATTDKALYYANSCERLRGRNGHRKHIGEAKEEKGHGLCSPRSITVSIIQMGLHAREPCFPGMFLCTRCVKAIQMPT